MEGLHARDAEATRIPANCRATADCSRLALRLRSFIDSAGSPARPARLPPIWGKPRRCFERAVTTNVRGWSTRSLMAPAGVSPGGI